jgi:hypothetical protein
LLAVTHLKGTVKGKSYLVARNGTFLAEPFRYLHLHHLPQFHSVSVSVSTAPVTHQDLGHDGEALYPLTHSVLCRNLWDQVYIVTLCYCSMGGFDVRPVCEKVAAATRSLTMNEDNYRGDDLISRPPV